MTKGTKIFLAVFAALIGVLVLYYGVFVPGEPTPAVSAVTRDIPAADTSQPPAVHHHRPQQTPPTTANPGAMIDAASSSSGFLTDSVRQIVDPLAEAPAFEPQPAPLDEVRPVAPPQAEPQPAAEPHSQPLANQPVSLPRGSDGGVRPASLATRPTAPAPGGVATNPRNTVEYTVKSGDTMSSIAEMWFGDRNKWSLIARENPLDDPNRLKVGQKLRLPPKDATLPPPPTPTATDSTTFTVRSGDTLARIAREVYGDVAMWETIYNLNKSVIGDDPGQLKPGMKLRLPPRR